MGTVSIRELRNRGGDVVGRVQHGEHITITRDGRPVAELRPVSLSKLSAAVFLERWRSLPMVDPDQLRADMDAIIEPWL
ncbi:MAG TPA: type II toxin-antitoxin system prevent-host-death family antitoxin [Chloroflexota bacterium]|nr:type II toxin-antitoxin system prevent-host-death family antitoxin [Chloroflexota bacterium]